MQRTQGVVCTFPVEDRQASFFVSDETDLIQGHHMRGEIYEPEELAIIDRHFAKAGCFVDIGANVGNHAVYVGLRHMPSKVIVFEPNPLVIPTLKINIALNGLQDVVDQRFLGTGLSDGEGQAKAEGQAYNLGATRLQGADDGNIPLRTGDSCLRRYWVNFIKIDVEGMEMKVLAGLAETIGRSHPKMFIEVDNVNVAAFNDWMAANQYAVVERYQRYPVNENYLVQWAP